MADTVIINGIVYEVLEAREDGTLVVCRPNGIKTYLPVDCLTIRCTEPIAARS